jgi:hypothetical protein
VLPIDPSKVHTIAIIGGHADVGMLSGGGSAQVDPPGGNAIMPPGKGATIWQKPVWFPTSPLKALQTKLPNAKIISIREQIRSRLRSSPSLLILRLSLHISGWLKTWTCRAFRFRITRMH